MNRFEQLIEYVINDEDKKAQELFHDIVVAKSREIYESMMDDEQAEELDEGTDDIEEGAMGGDAADSLIDDVEMEEESDINMEGEEDDMGDDMPVDDMGDDMPGDDMGGSSETATKDDIMNLEDKLDELMAQFEDMMGNGDDMGPEEGGDAIEMDDTEEMDDQMGMMEALQLKAAPKPVTSEEGNTNKKSTVAANSGARGAMAKPVHTGANEGGHHDTSAYRNTTKDLGVTPTQDAGKGAFKTAAPKPTMSQASGVNNKSPIPSGRG
jgi:hypothetical protein